MSPKVIIIIKHAYSIALKIYCTLTLNIANIYKLILPTTRLDGGELTLPCGNAAEDESALARVPLLKKSHSQQIVLKSMSKLDMSF